MTIPNTKPRAGEQSGKTAQDQVKDHSTELRSSQGNHWTKASDLALSLVGRPCEEILRHAWRYARQTEAERDTIAARVKELEAQLASSSPKGR